MTQNGTFVTGPLLANAHDYYESGLFTISISYNSNIEIMYDRYKWEDVTWNNRNARNKSESVAINGIYIQCHIIPPLFVRKYIFTKKSSASLNNTLSNSCLVLLKNFYETQSLFRCLRISCNQMRFTKRYILNWTSIELSVLYLREYCYSLVTHISSIVQVICSIVVHLSQPTLNVMSFDWTWAVKWDKLDNLSENIFIMWSVLNCKRKLQNTRVINRFVWNAVYFDLHLQTIGFNQRQGNNIVKGWLIGEACHRSSKNNDLSFFFTEDKFLCTPVPVE